MWALGFMYGTLHYGRSFRALNVIDESNREILAIEVDISLPEARAVRIFDQLEAIHGLPKAIQLDMGVNFSLQCLWVGVNLKALT